MIEEDSFEELWIELAGLDQILEKEYYWTVNLTTEGWHKLRDWFTHNEMVVNDRIGLNKKAHENIRKQFLGEYGIQ